MASRTYTRRQGVIPGSPFTCHTLQRGGPVQSVSWLAPVCDAAPREVTLVVDLEAKLRHTGVLAMRQLKALIRKKQTKTRRIYRDQNKNLLKF